VHLIAEGESLIDSSGNRREVYLRYEKVAQEARLIMLSMKA
jgi:hypothetical protein